VQLTDRLKMAGTLEGFGNQLEMARDRLSAIKDIEHYRRRS
jgi:hypothetical protein